VWQVARERILAPRPGAPQVVVVISPQTMRVAAISDLFAARIPRPGPVRPGMAVPGPPGLPKFVPQHAIPTVEELSEFDLIVVLGSISDADRAVELGGVLDHLLDRRKLIALAYYVRLDEPGLAAIASRLLPTANMTHGPSGHPVRSIEASWHGFFTSYGRSATSFANIDARVLGVVDATPAPLPVALELSSRAGALYVLPFHVGDRESQPSLERVVFALRDAIMSDREQMLPLEYLADLRLPGEQHVLARIA